MSLKTIIASVTLALSVAPEAGADWEKIQETEAGDFYTSVASSNVSANAASRLLSGRATLRAGVSYLRLLRDWAGKNRGVG